MNDKKTNLMYFVNLCMFILVMIFDILYIKLNIKGSLVLKGIASGLFVILGIINLVYALKNGTTNKKFSIIIVIGLIFAMLGDILLGIEFIVGAGFFAVGHIFFFVSYCFLYGFKPTDLIYGLAILIPSILVITLVPILKYESILMEIVCVIYAIIISFMLGKAVANFVREKNETSLMICFGSILFFFSDLMLLFNVFGGGNKVFDCLCLGTYYPAEVLLALSILIAVVFNKGTTIKNEKQVRANNKEEK